MPPRHASQPRAESLKKVLGGKVALLDGGQEQTIPGGEAEAKFCISLSKLLNLDEVSQGQVVYAFGSFEILVYV